MLGRFLALIYEHSHHDHALNIEGWARLHELAHLGMWSMFWSEVGMGEEGVEQMEWVITVWKWKITAHGKCPIRAIE